MCFASFSVILLQGRMVLLLKGLLLKGFGGANLFHCCFVGKDVIIVTKGRAIIYLIEKMFDCCLVYCFWMGIVHVHRIWVILV